MSHETELADLALAQKRLEVEKLRAEVDHARLSWWKRPGYLGGLALIVLALVGVVTAWANGYFDTQRAQLANEIALLEVEKDALVTQVADAQRAIDSGYLQAKLAAYDADYAIGHFEAFSEQAEAAKADLNAVLRDAPEQMKARAQQVIDVLEQQISVGNVTKKAVTEVLSQLDQIEATPWVKKLETDPMLSAERRFRGPEGRIFDVASWDWVEG